MDDLKQWLQTKLRKTLGDHVAVSWLWAAERYPSATNGVHVPSDGKVHVHGYIHHIPGVEPEELSLIIDDWTSEHGGRQRTYVGLVQQTPQATGTYIMKTLKLSKHGLFVAEVQDYIEDYFYLNGEDIVHATNGQHRFIRDETGRPISMREARSMAVERYREWRRGQEA